MSNKPLQKETSTFNSVNDAIDRVGGFGRFQQLLTLCFSIMILPRTFSTLIMYFAALKPKWKCSNRGRTNISSCHMLGPENATFPNSHTGRCQLPRNEWDFTKDRTYSIVAQFDIYCNDEWLILLTTSIFFIGWAFGAVLLGWVSDNYGRKKVIFSSYFVIVVIGFIAAFSPNITILVVCRFISGFFNPGTGVQSFILLSEFVNTKYRPYAATVLWFFFTVALCLLPLKAYFLMNWQLLFILCSAPYLFIMLSYKFIPESARWLHINAHSEEMLNVFRRIRYWNNKALTEEFIILPVKKRAGGGKHKANPLDLFRSLRMAVSTLAQGYIWMINGMVYYGLSLASDDLGGSLYTSFALLSAIEFPAYIIAMYTQDKIGRKKSTWVFMATGGVACVAVAFIPSVGSMKTLRVVLGMLGKLCITVSFSAIYTWSVEIYSTDIRSQGMGFLQITSRIGAASSPWIAKALKSVHHRAPFIVMGILSVVAVVACIPLPETNKKPIQDTMGNEDLNPEEMFDISPLNDDMSKNLV